MPLGLIFIVLWTAQGSRLKAQGKIWEIREVGKIGGVFLLGVLADILLLRPIGVTGAIYGGVVVLLRMYSRKFETARLTYLAPYTGIVVGLYSKFFYLEWRYQVTIALTVVVVVRWITSMIQQRYGRLRVRR